MKASSAGKKKPPRTILIILDRSLPRFPSKVRQNSVVCSHINWAVTWKSDILDTARLEPPTLWAAVEMIHNTLKSTQPSQHSPRSTHSAAQRKLWRYSGCRGAGQVESQRRSVCVLAADLNTGDGGGGGREGGGGVMHTIHGLCHLCIGCRLPQVCVLKREIRRGDGGGKQGN